MEGTRHLEPASSSEPPGPGARAVFEAVRRACGLDLQHYDPRTLLPRLERRVSTEASSDDRFEAYARRLREDPVEREQLLEELLIEVSGFFRDPDVFTRIAQDVLPRLFERRDRPVRLWVPGCASGEEAYTWAILVREITRTMQRPPAVTIFATDVHQASLEHGARGVYGGAALQDVPRALRERYFTRVEDGWLVSSELRSMLVFSRHNLLRDPPFVRLDAVSCRNVLSYLEPDARGRVLARLLFALEREGLLLLGPDEALVRVRACFDVVDEQARLFRKRLGARMPVAPDVFSDGALQPQDLSRGRWLGRVPRRNVYSRLLERFVPSGFLLDDRGALLGTFGDAGRFLDLEGPRREDFSSLVEGELRAAATAVSRRALRTRDTVSMRGVRALAKDGTRVALTLRAEPFVEPASEHLCVFVELASEPVAAVTAAEQRDSEPAADVDALQSRVRALEAQLEAAHDTLAQALDELEASNEEHRASNDALLGANEELLNTNEEMFAVSAELELRNAELLESNEDLERLLEAGEVGAVFVDRELRVRRFTALASRALELDEASRGRPLSELPSRLSSSVDLVAMARRAMDTQERAEREVHGDSGAIYLLRAVPTGGGEGHAEPGVLLALVDVTESRLLSRALSALEHERSATLDGISTRLAVLAEDGRILRVNQAWREFEGRLGGRQLGRDLFGLGERPVEEEVQGALRAGVAAVLAGREPSFEMEYTLDLGPERRWFRAKVASTADPEGAVLTHEEVTDSLRAARELRSLSSAIERARVGIFMSDARGVVLQVNPAFAQMMGYRVDELVGKPISILKSGYHDQTFYRAFWTDVRSGKMWQGRFVNRRKDGREVVAETSVAPVMLESDSAPQAFLALARDVTAEHRLEQHLSQAQKLSTLGQITGGVAHDFNNLLTPILGYAELLEEELSEDVREDLLLPICTAARTAQELTGKLLAFSRKQGMTFAQHDLNDLVRGFQGIAEGVVRASARIEYGLATEPLEVRVDREQVHQVLLNLLVNAKDASPAGAVVEVGTHGVRLDAVSVQRYPGLSPGDYAVLTVRDAGAGIPKDVLPHIFEPFFSTKRPGLGTGLGLSTAYGIVQQHGGAITLDTAPGLGTTFQVLIPRHAAGPRIAEPPPAEEIEGAGRHVVLIEDDHAVRGLAERMLRQAGFRVTSFASPREALRVQDNGLLEDLPDLVVSDVVMPEMNGRETVEALAEELGGFPVVFMSGFLGDVVDKLGVRALGPILQKPFTRRALLERAREALAGSR